MPYAHSMAYSCLSNNNKWSTHAFIKIMMTCMSAPCKVGENSRVPSVVPIYGTCTVQ